MEQEMKVCTCEQPKESKPTNGWKTSYCQACEKKAYKSKGKELTPDNIRDNNK